MEDLTMMRSHIRFLLAPMFLTFAAGCAGPDWTEKPAAMNAPTRIVLVRHGEAFVNLPHPADASPDALDHLTPGGLTQADVAGNRLKGEHVALIVTSPTGRARETAGSIAARLFMGSPPVADDAFAPLPPGAGAAMMSGPTGEMHGPAAQPAGMAAGVDRARQAIDALSRQHPGQTLVIVTHGDVIAGLLGHGVPVGSISELDIAAPPME
jgi:uncharacterized phosphatase